MADLIAADVRVKLDDSDQSMGWKCAEYEMRGVPIRLELGPRDLAEGNCVPRPPRQRRKGHGQDRGDR